MAVNADSRLIEVKGLTLNVSLRGKGPPLLLINGLGGLIRSFDPLRAGLKDFTTITLDVPGVGLSQKPPSPLRMPAHAEVLAALLDELGLARVDVFGVSWGGALAQEFALRYPARVGRLILAATSAGPFLLMKPGDLLAFFGTGIKSPSRALAQPSGRNSARSLLRVGGVHRMVSLNTRSYYHQMIAVLGWTSLTRLWRLRAPTLILAGETDPVTRLYNARILNKAIRRSTLVVLPDEGHFFIVTSAAETAASIRAFLRPASPALPAPAARPRAPSRAKGRAKAKA
ncbi:MAG: alpha/beta hydrolase [Pseudomonas sp.]|uniref:alpha/beta fold hydrolase n=1 Tax=Pseudomonas sp. TaxID=306 RepID=UPI00339681C9